MPVAPRVVAGSVTVAGQRSPSEPCASCVLTAFDTRGCKTSWQETARPKPPAVQRL
jgi:hypothetical protein